MIINKEFIKMEKSENQLNSTVNGVRTVNAPEGAKYISKD